MNDSIIPIHSTNTYRLYREDNGTVAIVALPGGDESQHDVSRFLSKPFYTAEGAELALFGGRLLQGEWLTNDERHRLTRLLIGGKP